MANEHGDERHTEESKHIELDLAKRGDGHTNHNQEHIAQCAEVSLGDTESPGGQQGHDGIGGLEHLDKGYTEVQVCQVTADQTQTEHKTDRHDGPPVFRRRPKSACMFYLNSWDSYRGVD